MTMFEHFFDEVGDLDFGDAISVASDEFGIDFEAHWGLDRKDPPEGITRDEWREIISTALLVEKLALGARILSRPPNLQEEHLARGEWLESEASKRQEGVDQVLEILRPKVTAEELREFEMMFHPGHRDDARARSLFFVTCFQLEAWKHFPCSPREMGGRLARLSHFMVEARGEFTQAYLSRVAACYVRGMTTEFAVMARAALDAAIQEVITDEEVLAVVGGGRGGGRVVLERRIQACRAKDWLSSELGRAADRLRENGRDAAHFTPGLTINLDELLEDLASVLRALEGVQRD